MHELKNFHPNRRPRQAEVFDFEHASVALLDVLKGRLLSVQSGIEV